MRPKAAIALLALGVVATASAVAQMPEMPLGKWWKQPRVVETLKLTTEQQDRLEEVFSKNRKTFVDLKADVEKKTIDLDELLARKDSDPKKVAAASEALELAKGKLGKARTMMVFEMKTVLTDEQWQKIESRREEWRRQLQNERRRPLRDNRPMRQGRPGASAPQEPLPPPDARE